MAEKALDAGGVVRDVFSAFWEEAVTRLFDGAGVVIPAVTPHSDMIVYCVLGTVLSHGFLESGYLPVRIAFPVVACALKGAFTDIPDPILLQSLLDYLSTYEADVVREALTVSEFSVTTCDCLLDMVSRFGCVQIPTPANLKTILIQVAHHDSPTQGPSQHAVCRTDTAQKVLG